ncbi:hypothetical protein [Sphingomonas sp. G-3-2-10]|uniref:hypothetical protein n=1 Tax=Sphingomonas sp. G-3-2-10 TaxID=2728838 RepID=UPI00146EC030|nr:hypothetical protein [Sphingomonas sp. G-3-2-10]NML05639.1 hypothetical protein [Sphingomonas sp. G-3-2-10]
MKYRDPCWAILEIEPISDLRAIRVAYTRKLKAIDPETDPQAFIALREAYDAAQIQAQWVDLPDDDDSDDDYDWEAEEWSGEPAAGYSYNPITGTATPLADAGQDDKFHALAGFLFPDGERRNATPGQDDERELNAWLDPILSDPRMEQVGFHADVERWLADLLARAWPASDAILLRSARHFGWDAGADPATHISPAIDFINARLRDVGRYGNATDPAIRPGPASTASEREAQNPLSPPRVDIPEAPPGITIPLPDSGPEWQRPEPAPRGMAINDPVSGPRFDPAVGDADPVPLPGGDGPEARPSPWAGLTPEQANAHAGALASLLHSFHGESGWPTPEQNQEMLAHWQALSADPRLQEVAYFADAERWFSDLIAHTSPVSDPLVRPVTRFFGWLASDGTISQSWSIATITQRFRMLEFMDAVQQHGHPLHAAWGELVRPAGEGSRRGFVGRRKVRDLLTIVRRDYPDLEGCFDGYRVSLWEDGGSSGGGANLGGWVAPLLFALFLIVRACTNMESSDYRPATAVPSSVDVSVQPPLANADAELDAILKDMLGDGIDMSTITKRNTPLAVALKAQWLRDREPDGPSFTLAPNVRALLRSWYTEGIGKADAGLLADHLRLVIDVARTLSATSSEDCVRFLESSRVSGPNFAFSEALLERERALMARTLLSARAPSPNAQTVDRNFMVPGDVVADAMRRSRLSEDQFSKATTAAGPIARQCTGRIALMEAILALPRKRGLPLMRKM